MIFDDYGYRALLKKDIPIWKGMVRKCKTVKGLRFVVFICSCGYPEKIVGGFTINERFDFRTYVHPLYKGLGYGYIVLESLKSVVTTLGACLDFRSKLI